MRRLLLVLSVGLMMAAMMLVMALPAFARGGGSEQPPKFIPDTASSTVAGQPVGGFGQGGEAPGGGCGGGRGPIEGAGGGGGGGSAGNPCVN